MHRAASIIVVPLLVLPLFTQDLKADGAPPEEKTIAQPARKNDKSFTGRITRDSVRMRLQPSTDSPVVKEMSRGDMVVVVGETEDFYAVKPPSSTKAYVYRPYILDGVVEGSKVNVRLDPHLEAPVIGQLNSGDRVNGTISEKNAKWLEIPPPASTLFYISSDYVEKVGDANYLTKYEERQSEVNHLLNATFLQSEAEMQKPFTDIASDEIIHNYEKVINDYTDFPEQAKLAQKYLTQFNEQLLHKKVDYLEKKSQSLETTHAKAKNQISEREQSQKERLANLESQLDRAHQSQNASKIYERWVNDKFASEVNARMALWIPVEIAYYEQWAENNNNRPIQDFYEEQKGHAVALRGILESFDRPVRNKPGDYLLVNKVNRLPIAYLYSTHVNLQDKLGHEITVEGVLRPNNHFAYPAYFVIQAD